MVASYFIHIDTEFKSVHGPTKVNIMVDNAIFESVLDVVIPVYNVASHLTSPDNTIVSWECFAVAHAVLFYASMRGLPFSVLRSVIVCMVAAFGGWVGLVWVLAYAISVEMNAYDRRHNEMAEYMRSIRSIQQDITTSAFIPLHMIMQENLKRVEDLVRFTAKNDKTQDSIRTALSDNNRGLNSIYDMLTLLREEMKEAREKKNEDDSSGK
jgi:hypothetical protein